VPTGRRLRRIPAATAGHRPVTDGATEGAPARAVRSAVSCWPPPDERPAMRKTGYLTTWVAAAGCGRGGSAQRHARRPLDW